MGKWAICAFLLLPIDVAPVTDFHYQNADCLILDAADDALVPDTVTP